MIGLIRNLLEGKHYSVEQFARRTEENDEEDVREVFESLAEDDILVQITSNRYVLNDDVDDEFAIQRIREESKKLSSDTDTVRVEVSGELMEDATFEHEGEPGDSINQR